MDEYESLKAMRADRPRYGFATPAAEAIARADSLTARFREVVERRFDATALVHRDERWTYGALYARASRIAHAVLAAAGQGNEPVALLYPHGAPMIAAILGVLGAGKFYVPLLAADPAPRLQTIVRESGCKVVLAASALMDTATHLALDAQLIDDANLSETGDSWDARAHDSIAYLLFTSGTTGTPKGVMQCDRNVLHHAACYASTIGLHADDRMTLLPYYGFDASVMDIFATLLTGGSLHLRDIREDGIEGIGDWLAREGITIWHSTPSVLRAAFPTLARHVPLRWVVLGGEAATGADVALVTRHAGEQCRLLNGLGPTECTTALQYIADPATDTNAVRLPIGRPVPGIEVELLDAQGNVTQDEGELAIVSEFVALGYWGKPDLTAERFQSTQRNDGARRYRTGDLIRLAANGQFEHLTRVDDQIKIRGFRVELGEINAAICEHPEIRQAIVLPRMDERGQQTVVAYVVMRSPDAPIEPVRNHVGSRLPSYMVPQAFVRLDAIPLLPNGKLDRRALPAPESKTSADVALHKKPSTPLQRVLAGCWAQVLQRETVGIDESFFELGGDSLLGMQLLACIKRDLELEARLGDLFRHPTVESLADFLLASQPA